MDLSQFSTAKLSEEGSVLKILDEYGEPLVAENGEFVTITLLGRDGEKYQKHLLSRQDRRLKDLQRGKKYTPPTSTEMHEEELERSALCTVAWTNIDKGGEEYPCTYENALALYRSNKYVADQVESFISDRSNFFTKRVKPSSSTTSEQ